MVPTKLHATHGFNATMKARPGKADELIDLLMSNAPTENPSCVLYLVGRSASDPDLVTVAEGWTTKAAHAANFARSESQSFIAKIAPLLQGDARYEDTVPVGGVFRG